ncbi:MAG: glucose-6-phosphate isomerase [Phycisphaerae bacterium]|jgi:glucose-6-phosphate isomerase|nr:glucose-6-phosphate isomerase [Phycisphaerae bacterium]
MNDEQMRLLSTPFDLVTGLSSKVDPIRRQLSAMSGMYADAEAFADMVAAGDPLVYEFYDLGVPADAGEIAFGTSITYPGKVGNEYFMTKGHFHSILETAEVYYCLSGEGRMMMENPEGDWKSCEMTAGAAVYVPARYAHRSINTSNDQPLVTFFAFRGDAGHDYGTIEDKGFRNLVVERDGRPVVISNPKWGSDPEDTQ